MISRVFFERFGRKLYKSLYIEKKIKVNFMLREQLGVVVFCLLVENALSFKKLVSIIIINKLLNYNSF